MKKYIITALSSLILEIASTMYISTVSDKSIYMIFWAFIGPFLSLPFAGYIVDARNWKERIYLAFSLSVGYTIGSFIIYLTN
jgi:hypothetical protein